MTDDEIQEWKDRIDGMTQQELASLWRFSPSGHPVFDRNLPLFEHFQERFGGFTPQISKAIGW